jgi:hypothetical protein
MRAHRSHRAADGFQREPPSSLVNEHQTARVHHICRKHAAAPFAARATTSVSDRTLRQRLARSASTLRFSILRRADEVIEQRGRSVFDQSLFGFD